MTENPPQPSGTTAAQANQRLARTMNIALNLGAPAEASWTLPVSTHDLDHCAQAGFTAVRLVASLALHRNATDPHRLDPATLEQLNTLIDAATDRGLAVVLANMTDPQLMADPARHRDRLLTCTDQLAGSMKDHGPTVILEPLAEPRDALDAVWNSYVTDLCATVRAADPHRTIVIGPRSYNNARHLGELALPEQERNLIVTIHHYWPIRFTMQGETWLGITDLGNPADWLGTTWDRTPQQKAELEAGFDAVGRYAHTQQRPIFIGEFGTTTNADTTSRATWTRFNRELAERHHFSWGYWSYAPLFAIYATDHHRWHHDLLDALIPVSTHPGPVSAAPSSGPQ